MRIDKISQFQITVCNSALHKLDFALVYPPNFQVSPTTTEMLTKAYINYHLAIKPNVPVALFQLESLDNAGSRVYGGSKGCPEIYHLPPRIYNELEDIVAEGTFIVSETYLEMVIRAKCLNKSIFGLLHGTRQEIGLNVLGVYGGDTDAVDAA